MTSFFQSLLTRIVDRGRRLVVSQDGHGDGDLLELAKALLSEKGEASGVALAHQALESYRGLDRAGKRAFFTALAEEFGPDDARIAAAIESYRGDPSQANAMALHEAAEPRRQELIRRLNRAPGGTAELVAMRADLVGLLKDLPALAPLDRDFDHLLSSWFNRGFLVLERIDWNTPASILEKIIRYEAVHEIRSWDDLRRRIEPSDRRCYGFFHPALVDEPLIFVEVALTRGVPAAIAPILSGEREQLPAARADTAVFYSISNCQKGLRGVSFGSFLIKQVVEELARDLPALETYVTLSPLPGFRAWLDRLLEAEAPSQIDERERALLAGIDGLGAEEGETGDGALKDLLLGLAATYLVRAKRRDGGPLDPVARFHLGNGARLERINWRADLSPGGLERAAGIMVNYLYDLRHIEENHERFVKEGRIASSGAVRRLARNHSRERELEGTESR